MNTRDVLYLTIAVVVMVVLILSVLEYRRSKKRAKDAEEAKQVVQQLVEVVEKKPQVVEVKPQAVEPTKPTGDPWKVTIARPGSMSNPIRLVAIGSQTMSKPIWIVPKGGDPIRIVKYGTTSDPCRIVAGLENLPEKYLDFTGE